MDAPMTLLMLLVDAIIDFLTSLFLWSTSFPDVFA